MPEQNGSFKPLGCWLVGGRPARRSSAAAGHSANIRGIRGRLLPLNWCLFACHAVAAYSAEALRRLDRAKVRVHLSRRSLGEGGFVVS